MRRVAIIAAEFNKDLVDGMVLTAIDELRQLGFESPEVIRVPGCYEVPFVAQLFLAREDILGLSVLGYIERGETLHGEVMGHVVHSALVDLQIRFNKPIGLGIIGPGATLDQAVVRHENTARAAVRALGRLLGLLASGEV